MRRADKEIIDPDAPLRLLRDAPVGRLGTAGPDGPMVKPVNFLWHDEAIWIHSAMEGEKIEHLQADPRVCFQVEGDLSYRPATDAPCKATFHFLSVIVTGAATFIDDPAIKVTILNALMEKYQPEGGYRPVTEEMTRQVALIRIDKERLTAKRSPAPEKGE